jgi:hypothetical protein
MPHPRYPFKVSRPRIAAGAAAAEAALASLAEAGDPAGRVAALVEVAGYRWLAGDAAGVRAALAVWPDAAAALADHPEAPADAETTAVWVSMSICAQDPAGRDLLAARCPADPPVWQRVATTWAALDRGDPAPNDDTLPSVRAVVDGDAAGLRRQVATGARHHYDAVAKLLRRERPEVLVDWVTTALLVVAARRGLEVPTGIALYPTAACLPDPSAR